MAREIKFRRKVNELVLYFWLIFGLAATFVMLELLQKYSLHARLIKIEQEIQEARSSDKDSPSENSGNKTALHAKNQGLLGDIPEQDIKMAVKKFQNMGFDIPKTGDYSEYFQKYANMSKSELKKIFNRLSDSDKTKVHDNMDTIKKYLKR